MIIIRYICTSPQIKYLVPSFVVSVGAFLIYNIMKLHAKEIRICNYLNVFYKGEFKEIHTVEIATFSMFLEGFDLQGIYFKPIPLTEEWLLKFGFNKTNESKDVEWYSLNSFDIAIHEDDNSVYIVFQHLVLKHITKVHQLQNLYFALTGIELTLIK